MCNMHQDQNCSDVGRSDCSWRTQDPRKIRGSIQLQSSALCHAL